MSAYLTALNAHTSWAAATMNRVPLEMYPQIASEQLTTDGALQMSEYMRRERVLNNVAGMSEERQRGWWGSLSEADQVDYQSRGYRPPEESGGGGVLGFLGDAVGAVGDVASKVPGVGAAGRAAADVGVSADVDVAVGIGVTADAGVAAVVGVTVGASATADMGAIADVSVAAGLGVTANSTVTTGVIDTTPAPAATLASVVTLVSAVTLTSTAALASMVSLTSAVSSKSLSYLRDNLGQK